MADRAAVRKIYAGYYDAFRAADDMFREIDIDTRHFLAFIRAS